MKKIYVPALVIFTGLLFLITNNGCKKDSAADNSNTTGNYYVHFKVDGTEISYVNGCEGTINVVDGAGRHQCNIAGLKEQFVADKGTLTIIMTNDDVITTGITYTNYATAASGFLKSRLNQLARYDDSGSFCASWGDEYASFGVVSDTKVNFTEISNEFIRGNFSATIYRQIDGNAEKHYITDGEFKVKRIN